MNDRGAKQTILLCMMLSAVIVFVSGSANRGEGDPLPSSRVFIGTIIATVMLSVLANSQPKGAKYFAILVFTGTLLRNGAPAFTALKRLTDNGLPGGSTGNGGRPR